jgi:pimeloyl-ACP methyl ester carboxylesterase
VNDACLERADSRLLKSFGRAENGGACPTLGDAGRVLRLSEGLVNRAVAGLVSDAGAASVCTSGKLSAGGKRVLSSAQAHGENVKNDDVDKLVQSFESIDQVFDRNFARAEDKGDCQTASDQAEAAGLFDSGLDSIYAAVRVVDFETAQIPSPAQPDETPGSPGVDANDYPKLVTQLGDASFSLNNATYTRFFVQAGDTAPDAILVLVPGFEGGGASFKMLAENLVTRALENGLRLEVWAYDRRGNQIEDREGVTIAVDARDPQIALDWFFGSELGLPLHPALISGPNRRAIIHDTQADTAFIANWTSLVFSRDIDAIVEAARGVAQNQNVFLGGHSAGTGFTARYAATDFDLTGGGPSEPGFGKLRGLVLLEGGGGSTAGGPPSEDQLDRIEDRADGGLFFAVRDGAPRCADGTPCTVASEAVDCAGIGRGTCTEPTPAYAVVTGLLNPRVLASAEPGAVQGLDFPDTDQVIIQVDQGAPGNNAIAQVPDLGALVVIPSATPEGALGTFLDDDGFISAFATFVRTSVGAPGPLIEGLLTWQNITEGPLPSSALPDNGPPPTALPAAEWGQEKEVTRIDRLAATFTTPGSNFSDWYYPSSGLATTAGTTLDTTPLSVGRGRRDIENRTQAANVDIPVICFGGTNGLTEVPASYLAFAQSIGTCASSSCDGTPRVVDPSTPNPAFPTFGDVRGGYEVHLSEGYAHVDIVTAEDDADNNVIGPLIDFVVRNLE